MSYANQIVEGFLDKIQDVGLIAMQNLLMNNAHPIVKIIKVIQDAKIFAKTIQVIQLAKGLNYLDSQALLIPAQLPQQLQQQRPHDNRRHRDLEEKNQFNHLLKKKKNIIIIIMNMVIIIMVVLPDTTHFIAFTTTPAMAEGVEMAKSE